MLTYLLIYLRTYFRRIKNGKVMVLDDILIDTLKRLGSFDWIQNPIGCCRVFTSQCRLTPYKARVKPCMEYCSHLWDSSAKYELQALNTIEKRARKLVKDKTLLDTQVQSLRYRRVGLPHCLFFTAYISESVPRNCTT